MLVTAGLAPNPLLVEDPNRPLLAGLAPKVVPCVDVDPDVLPNKPVPVEGLFIPISEIINSPKNDKLVKN